MKTRMRNVMLGAMLVILLTRSIGYGDLSDGLVAYYPFNGNANDESGNGHHGDVRGDTILTQDRSGEPDRAYYFDGLYDYIDLGTDPDLTPEVFSVSAWFRTSFSGDKQIIYGLTYGADPQIEYAIFIDAYTAVLVLKVYDKFLYGVTPVTDGKWHHVVAMRTTENVGSIFLDGKLEVTGEMVGPVSGRDPPRPYYIGAAYEQADRDPPAYEFEGSIDEVLIYKRALELSEIQQLAGTAEPDIDVSPTSYDFGDVEIGSSTTMFVSIFNTGDGDLSIESFGFSAGSSSNFSITTAPSLPATVVPGGTADIEITFAPSAVYYSSAVLEIGSNDPDESFVTVDLSGVGVVIETPPSEQVQEIITFIEDSVSVGELSGEGPGSSADKKLNAMINMIEAVGNLISDGLYEEAQQQLEDILKKCDGESPPPDFVTGPAASNLVVQIYELMQIIKGAVVITVDGISLESTLWGIINVNWPYDDEDYYLGTALASTGLEAYNVDLVDFEWSRDSGNTYEEVRVLRDFLRQEYNNKTDGKKFIVVAHSWGTVLSYYALSDLSTEGISCDLYITLSCPLGVPYADPPNQWETWLAVYTLAKHIELAEDADNNWIGNPNALKHRNYWAWGDFISGPLGGQAIDDPPVDKWDENFLDPDHRDAEAMLKWHKFTSLQTGGPIDNSAFRQSVADLIMQTLRE